MGDRVTLAKKLLDGYHMKALELLVTYLQDQEIRTATEQYIGQHNPSPTRLDAAFEPHPRSSQTRPHQPDPSLLQRTSRQSISDARHGFHTPPTSAGSVKSQSSSLAATGREKIHLLSCDDDGTEQQVIARSAPVKHNLIRDKVAYFRSLGASIIPVEEKVFVPSLSGNSRWERVTTAVNLTWRRLGEFTTNMDTFYIVPAALLDSDVIMGSDGSLERQYPSDVQEPHSPPARYPRGGFVVEELDQAVPPHAPTAPMHPFQQTSISPKVQQTYDRMQTLREIQQMPVAEPSASAPHQRHMDHGQPTHTPPPLATQGTSGGQLRVMGIWDKTPIQMSFDPDASGEAFYQAFHQWAVGRDRGGELERHRMTLWLKTSRSTPDDEAYILGLKEGELEELWETAIDWIQRNKSPKAPHLYATVELEAG